MAIRFDAATDQIIGPGWGGTVFTVVFAWRQQADTNNFADPFLIYPDSGGAGAVRGGFGTSIDGTTMNVFDSAFATQAAGAPGVDVWYCGALVANADQWTVYHGSDPVGGLTAVGPNTRNTITAPGSIVLSLDDEPFSGDLAVLKVWTRALTQTEVEDELASYAVLDSTNLIRSHSWRTSTSMTPDSGSGGALTAGSTAVTLVPGPMWLTDVTGELAGSAPVPTGALEATTGATGALAGTTPVPTGALAADVGVPAALAGVAPVPVGSLAADIAIPGELAATAPQPRGTLAEVLPLSGPVRVGTPVLESAASGWRVGSVDLDG
jgi:hypothetical protein